MTMSNAASGARHQRSFGRLKDFNSCTRWRPVRINKERLERWAGTKALHSLLDMHTICPKETQIMMNDGMFKDLIASTLTRIIIRC